MAPTNVDRPPGTDVGHRPVRDSARWVWIATVVVGLALVGALVVWVLVWGGSDSSDEPVPPPTPSPTRLPPPTNPNAPS